MAIWTIWPTEGFELLDWPYLEGRRLAYDILKDLTQQTTIWTIWPSDQAIQRSSDPAI